MADFFIDLTKDVVETVRNDVTGFWAAFLCAMCFFLFVSWLAGAVDYVMVDTASCHYAERGRRWARRNWLYIIVAFWYWPRASTIISFVDKHATAMLLGFLASLIPYIVIMLSDVGSDLIENIVFELEHLIRKLDQALRGILAVARLIVRRFPLQFGALILLVVFAGSLAQPQPIMAESDQIITLEPATKEEPYAPQTTVSGDRYVTELVTQSPIVSGRINDAYVVVETVGAPISIRWIVEGRTAVIDVLSDEPVMIGFSGVGGADKSVQGTRQSYEHGKLFKLTIPSDWESPNITIGVHGEQGSTIMINWFPS